MPFTFAHPAVVLPFNYLPKKWTSLTGLIIGSVTPDFEYFIRMKVESIYSHTLPGLFWFDLPLGLVLFFLYQHLIKKTLIAHLPNWLIIRLSRFKNTSPYSPVSLTIIMLSILIGSASHLLWDGFTHRSGYFVNHIYWLQYKINIHNHHIYIYKIAQHGSTLIGLIAIFYAIYHLPMSTQVPISNSDNFWLLIFAACLLTVGLRLIFGLSFRVSGNLLVTGIAGGLLGLIIASMLIRPVKR